MKESVTAPADISSEVYAGIVNEMTSSDSDVQVILDQVLEIRGKAVRPLFMAMIASLVKGTWAAVRDAAVIIEAIHLASLLHDDVLDGSDLRRGVETINARYSDKVSVLTGDFIVIRAIRMAQAHRNPEVLKTVLLSVERMVNGEIRDSLVTGVIDEDTYLSIVGDKTASLFAASGELAVMLSGGSKKEVLWGRELGEYVGMAFQIVDDTLDYRGDLDTLGKPGLMDARAGRMTLPLIYSLRNYAPESIEKLLEDMAGSAGELSALVAGQGGIGYALGRAGNYLDSALKVARRFNGTRESLDSLDDFFDALVARKY